MFLVKCKTESCYALLLDKISRKTKKERSRTTQKSLKIQFQETNSILIPPIVASPLPNLGTKVTTTLSSSSASKSSNSSVIPRFKVTTTLFLYKIEILLYLNLSVLRAICGKPNGKKSPMMRATGN